MGEPSEATQQRRVIYYSGRVQGVGFRYHTLRIAQRFPVIGYVQNLTDGRVLLVAESAPEVLDQFVTQVHEELGRFIEGQDASTRPATGEFRDFRIRH